MLKFTDFSRLNPLLEKKTKDEGTYVAVYPDEDSIGRICDLCMRLDLSNMMDSDKLHATVLYSRKGVDATEAYSIVDKQIPIHAIGDELRLFDQQDGNKCLVLELSSVGLVGVHHALKKIGGVHDYPTFRAHVTLLRDIHPNYEIPKLDVSVNIEFTKVKVEPINPTEV